MLLIGSQALDLFTDLNRVPQDYDFICTPDELIDFATKLNLSLKQSKFKEKYSAKFEGQHLEFELSVDGGSNHVYMQHAGPRSLGIGILMGDIVVKAAPPSVLYSVKRAHRYYPVQWHKHMNDYHMLKTMMNGVDTLPQATALREAETAARYGDLKTPSLNKNSADFFNDKVSNKVFIHDQIHEMMAHRERPMYEYYKKDSNTVACCKDKFLELPIEQRVQGVLEEAYVIALERGIIPMLFSSGPLTSAEDALNWAIMRIGTTLTSGWFREFAVENYPLIMASRDLTYAEKFLAKVDDRKIQRIIQSSCTII
jgi:hypothetical protein